MGSVIAQISAVIVMNVRSFPQRVWMSLATVVAVAIVVAVLLAFLAMGSGFKATLNSSGSDELAIILRAGSQAELNSSLSGEQSKILEVAPGIAKDASGPVVSPELYVIVDGIKKSTGTEVNIPFRGIGQRGIELRNNVSISEGRMFIPGKNEIIVGVGVLREFSGFELGKDIKLGNAEWKVVGVFEAQGAVFESELWSDTRTIQSQFNRGNSYQIMRVALATPGDLSLIKEYIEAEPRLNLDVKTEAEYFKEQSSSIKGVIIFGWFLAVAMALGALAGALNTMYTSVSQRQTEIATLRAIGFSSLSAFVGTLVESLGLALVGGILGTAAAFLFFDGMTASTLGGNFSQIVFDFQLSAESLKNGIVLALMVGLVGGFFPALRASRLPVVLAFTSSN